MSVREAVAGDETGLGSRRGIGSAARAGRGRWRSAPRRGRPRCRPAEGRRCLALGEQRRGAAALGLGAVKATVGGRARRRPRSRRWRRCRQPRRRRGRGRRRGRRSGARGADADGHAAASAPERGRRRRALARGSSPGIAVAQTSCAIGQRVRKWQPEGGSIGLGTSPSGRCGRGGALRGSATGTAESSASV